MSAEMTSSRFAGGSGARLVATRRRWPLEREPPRSGGFRSGWSGLARCGVSFFSAFSAVSAWALASSLGLPAPSRRASGGCGPAAAAPTPRRRLWCFLASRGGWFGCLYFRCFCFRCFFDRGRGLFGPLGLELLLPPSEPGQTKSPFRARAHASPRAEGGTGAASCGWKTSWVYGSKPFGDPLSIPDRLYHARIDERGGAGSA